MYLKMKNPEIYSWKKTKIEKTTKSDQPIRLPISTSHQQPAAGDDAINSAGRHPIRFDGGKFGSGNGPPAPVGHRILSHSRKNPGPSATASSIPVGPGF